MSRSTAFNWRELCGNNLEIKNLIFLPICRVTRQFSVYIHHVRRLSQSNLHINMSTVRPAYLIHHPIDQSPSPQRNRPLQTTANPQLSTSKTSIAPPSLSPILVPTSHRHHGRKRTSVCPNLPPPRNPSNSTLFRNTLYPRGITTY